MRKFDFFKKFIAFSLIMAVLLSFVPSQTAFAAGNGGRVEVVNASRMLGRVSISTPGTTANLYSGLTWQQLEMECGTRLIVTDSDCGPDARNFFNTVAKMVGGGVTQIINVRLEHYLGGWTQKVDHTNSPLRLSFTLKNGDPNYDFGIISIGANGTYEVLADLDLDPNTLTVDTSFFDVYAVIATPKGGLTAFLKPDLNSLNNVVYKNYQRKVGSTIPSESKCAYVYGIGIETPADQVKSLIGGNPTIGATESIPGVLAIESFQRALKGVPYKNLQYLDPVLVGAGGRRVETTALPLRVTLTAPFNYPAYADYAVAVIHMDGSVTIHKDLNPDPSFITIDATDFRTWAVLWGDKGAFNLY